MSQLSLMFYVPKFILKIHIKMKMQNCPYMISVPDFFYSQSHTWVHFDSLGRENILAGRRGCSCFLECNIFHHSDFLSTISILHIFSVLATCLWLSSWLHVRCRKEPTIQGRPERKISNVRLCSEALSQNEQKSPTN